MFTSSSKSNHTPSTKPTPVQANVTGRNITVGGGGGGGGGGKISIVCLGTN